jgi:hypothetical protein
MIGISNYDVVENFDFEKLTSSNEVTSDFYVSFRWSWIPTYAAYGISGVRHLSEEKGSWKKSHGFLISRAFMANPSLK